MATLDALLTRLSADPGTRGRQFERICKWYLLTDLKGSFIRIRLPTCGFSPSGVGLPFGSRWAFGLSKGPPALAPKRSGFLLLRTPRCHEDGGPSARLATGSHIAGDSEDAGHEPNRSVCTLQDHRLGRCDLGRPRGRRGPRPDRPRERFDRGHGPGRSEEMARRRRGRRVGRQLRGDHQDRPGDRLGDGHLRRHGFYPQNRL
jgi:hypothetical protein